MTHEELLKRLEGYEWNDAEFKRAQRGVPENAYETVSAFANTAGGWLVFGVEDVDDGFEVVGVLEVDTVQNDFLSALRTGQKLNRVVRSRESLHDCDGRQVLVFYVPEASRQEKPVYLGNDIRKSFIRRGGCDERCTREEIERFVRDAAAERFDGNVVELDPEHCFDHGTVEWYRRLFNERNPSADPSQSHLEFLHEWGFVVEHQGSLRPTLASVLLFGSNAAFRQHLPRPVLDCQWSNVRKEQVTSEVRWSDRLVAEVNLLQAWRLLIEKFMAHSTTPFELDPATMQRRDAPADYIAFREAAVNLLIHQDYADHSRKGEIRFYADRVEFWNPGDAFASAEQLLEPGEKEVRNPRIVAAFRRIGLSEQAGTGVRTIFNNWRGLGHVPPEIRNDKAEKTFGMSLLQEQLISEEQVLFQARVGVHLTDPQAKVLAYVCRRSRVTLLDARVVTGLPTAEAQKVLDSLVTQVLLTAAGTGTGASYSLAEHLVERLAEPATDQAPPGGEGLVSDQPTQDKARLVTDQPPPVAPNRLSGPPSGGSGAPLQSLTDAQWRIVGICEAPRTAAAIMEHLGLTHRSFFRRTHLEPLLRAGVLAMTHPDSPNHPDQAYFLTPAGLKLKELRAGGQRPQPEAPA
ncbi:MAG: putative DNA binding domain-containing protein [Thermoleophilia bacterium]|nr:putative DNA binding domain-containing protein [Thermoleophilia bacterium]